MNSVPIVHFGGLDIVSDLEAVHVTSTTQLAAALASSSSPVVVIAVGSAVGQSVALIADVGGVGALCLVGGSLQPTDVELIAEWPELALLVVVDPAARDQVACMVEAFLASAHPASDLLVGPLDDSRQAMNDWIGERRRSMFRVDEVRLVSEDGWEIHGTRSLPQNGTSPGVVLLHSGRSDRSAFVRLEHLLLNSGIAVLNIDWRGRGESVNLGSYFNLSDDAKFLAWRDAAAAIEHLASCAEVDEQRIGVVGVVHGAEYAARASHRDARVKALVLLTGYRPVEPEEAAHLVSGDIEVMYVTSAAHQVTTAAMRDLFRQSPGRSTEYVEYPGGAIGYQLFDLDPSLEPRIVAWLEDTLGARHDN